MRIVVADGGQERELDVRGAEDARVADLCEVLFGGSPDADSLYVEGREVVASALVTEAGIAAGAQLGLEPPRSAAAATVDLQVLSGPGAGGSIGLPTGTHVVGSGSGANVAYRARGVRARHAALHVGGDGRVSVGPPDQRATHAVTHTTMIDVGGPLLGVGVRRSSADKLRAMPGRRGTVAFNRPPRPMPVAEPMAVTYPEALKPPTMSSRLSMISLIVPVVFGLALAILIHPRMALFAMLGPVMMIGSWFEDRRRKRKYVKESAAQDEHDSAVVTAALDCAAVDEVVRRHRAHPRVAELAGWPLSSTRLWERRRSHSDFMRLVAGYGAAPWRPPTEGNPTAASDLIRSLVGSRTRLPRGPVTIDVSAGSVVGVAGPRAAGLDLARGLICQAAVLHGPSDLRIAIVTDHPADWKWAGWLPHTLIDTAAERRLLAATPEDRSRLVADLTPTEPERGTPGWGAAAHDAATAQGPETLLIVDVAGLAESDGAGVRLLLSGRGETVAGIVLAPSVDVLPSVCSVVIETRGHRARMSDSHGSAVDLATAGADPAVATKLARDLARYTDPDRREDGAELPASLSLVELLAGGMPAPDDIARRWRNAAADPPLAAPIGVTESGPLVLDIGRDGPHGLLAGTTGSGKSELLRTLVASLAVAVDPEHLTFVLIDYKGGSAFDACAQLPHTVGMVTDLDDQLAARALQCLEAELRYREHRLRDAAADDLAAYLADSPEEPLPRMLIVIDEFAALAKELPDFMDALVDIAARGRSLGVHLLLATQRPAGVIRENVRANTNLRMALRVQDRADSNDVLGDTRAADIARSQPGRGFVRFGPSEVIPFQTALVTGVSGDAGAEERIAVRETPFAMELPEFAAATVTGSGPTDLDRLVATVDEAARIAGCRPPRRPWPDPLPETLVAGELDVVQPPTTTAVPIGLVDEPDYQRQRTMWWDPRQGSLALYGLTGAGTTTSLATIATSLAHRYAPDELHLYVMDFDAGALSPLAELPHVGAVVAAAERERQVRLVRHLSIELERRKRQAARGGDPGPLTVLLVDNFAGFAAAFDSAPDAPIRDALYRVVMEGPGVGMMAVLTGVRQNAIPLAVAATIPSKLVFRMADPLAAATFGLRRISPDLPTGRAIHVASKREIQIAMPHADGIAAAVAAASHNGVSAGGPQPIDELPHIVKSAQVASSLRILDEDWWLPVGIADADLAATGLPLGPGDHVLVAGEARSGRSSLLCAIGEVVAQQRPDTQITVIALRKSPLRELAVASHTAVDQAAIDEVIAAIDETGGPHLVLIDDIDGIEATPALRDLVTTSRPDVHVVAAGRRDLKSQYNHWARDLCRSRVGIWLRPGPGLDGDLWSTPMPRHVPAGMPVGRGYIVAHGIVELMQAMAP